MKKLILSYLVLLSACTNIETTKDEVNRKLFAEVKGKTKDVKIKKEKLTEVDKMEIELIRSKKELQKIKYSLAGVYPTSAPEALALSHIPEALKEAFIKSEILPHIKVQEDLAIVLNKELETIKNKSKCDITTNLCNFSKHDDPIQRMKENDICLSLLDATRISALKNCPKKEETQP